MSVHLLFMHNASIEWKHEMKTANFENYITLTQFDESLLLLEKYLYIGYSKLMIVTMQIRFPFYKQEGAKKGKSDPKKCYF